MIEIDWIAVIFAVAGNVVSGILLLVLEYNTRFFAKSLVPSAEELQPESGSGPRAFGTFAQGQGKVTVYGDSSAKINIVNAQQVHQYYIGQIRDRLPKQLLILLVANLVLSMIFVLIISLFI